MDSSIPKFQSLDHSIPTLNIYLLLFKLLHPIFWEYLQLGWCNWSCVSGTSGPRGRVGGYDKPVVVDGIPISIRQARGSQTLHPPILFLAHIHPMVFSVFLSVAEELAQLACRVSSSQVADQHPPGPLASSWPFRMVLGEPLNTSSAHGPQHLVAQPNQPHRLSCTRQWPCHLASFPQPAGFFQVVELCAFVFLV